MRGGVRIGRVAGIAIRIDWSWILILILITWNLAASVFPSIHPNWSPLLLWSLAIAAALLFFLSILAHELAHSIVAVKRGMPVKEITLFMFGGVSNIEKEPETPGQEFWVTIVGPLTSLILGLFFLGIGAATLPRGTGQSTMRLIAGLSPLQTLMLWLGPVNIALAVFNLIPGFPLDGGRILRSFIWALTKNYKRATRWAARVGQAVGWIMIFMGIAMVFGFSVPFFGRGAVGGVWLVLIGWFLRNAAEQSYNQVIVTDLLEGVSVGELMNRNTINVPPNISVETMVDQYIMSSDQRAFPVQEEDTLVGLVCLSDIRKVSRQEWAQTRVADIMTPLAQIDVIEPQEDAAEALTRLSRKDVRQLPVVQNGRLLGLVRQQDIVRWLQWQAERSRI